MTATSVARSVALNEQELWREMVRWSGGLIHEQDGLLFVAGPSRYLRVAIRTDDGRDGVETLRLAGEFFGAADDGHIVLIREPEDADLAQLALSAGYTPAWTERSMTLDEPPDLAPLTTDIDLRDRVNARAGPRLRNRRR